MRLLLSPAVSLPPLLLLTLTLLLDRSCASSVLSEPNEVVIMNKTIVLSCTLEGNEVVNSWRWEKDGHTLDAKNSNLVSRTLTHTIEKPVTSDAGSYHCVFKTDSGEKDSFIIVSTEPKIAPHKKHHESRTDGETARIKCIASGFPAFNWTWFHTVNGVLNLVQNGTDRREVYTHGNYTILTITTVESGKDEGNYTCRASNSVGSDEAVMAVRIHSRMASVWIFLGLVVEVIVLISIIFIYEKRTTKKEVVIQEDEPKPLKSDMHSEKEDGVRQRN
ncbi:basigin-like isoform X1 [Petromyzon marinus]|uniref:basigin-like isoform X1 n=1 Tax=Petromyzon marinus TaxID=7757 RepID=UPI003F71585B